MRTCVDRGGGLAPELLERKQSVVAAAQPVGPLVDETPDEGPILVQRRSAAHDVLLEGERQLTVLGLELPQEVGKRAERVGTKGVMELR